jgi:TonB family protein
MGGCYFFGKYVPQNRPLGKLLLQKAKSQGSATAALMLSLIKLIPIDTKMLSIISKGLSQFSYQYHDYHSPTEITAGRKAEKEQRLIALFARKIYTQVYNAWDAIFPGPLSCTIQMELNPKGQIIGQPRIIHSSGNPRFDQAVIATVEAAAPFTPPNGLSSDLYKEVDLKLNAKKLNHG